MPVEPVTPDELRVIARDVGELRGWDFSAVRDERDPVPWDYQDLVRCYLRPDSRVLDIGTGGRDAATRAVRPGRALARGQPRDLRLRFPARHSDQ
jgi:hypothetical protein